MAGLLFCVWPSAAQRTALDPSVHPFVQATGEAAISAKPDQARIDIGVTTQGSSAAAVAAQNATQVDAVLAQLRPLVGKSGELKTASYSVNPNYNYPRTGQPAISGYTATNIVEVTANDLALAGKIIDAATQSGANTIQRLQFTLKNQQPVRAQALRDASAQAKANAEAMAAGLGMHTGRVLSMEEGTPAPIVPLMRQMPMAAAATAAPTPVEAGSIEVRATVTLRVELVP